MKAKRNIRLGFERRAAADQRLLRLLNTTLERSDCAPDTIAFARELQSALHWWIDSGRSGQEIPRPKGMTAIEAIVRAWRASQE